MAYSEVDSNNLNAGKPGREDDFKQLNENIKDVEARLNNLESGGARVIIFNSVINVDVNRVGSCQLTLLTAAQFIARYGKKWAFAAGQSLTTKDLGLLYGATMPTLGNAFLRILGGGRSIGSYQSDDTRSHVHDQKFPNVDDTYDRLIETPSNNTGVGGYATVNTAFHGLIGQDSRTNLSYVQTYSTGGTETRPENTMVNLMVREDDIETDGILYFRAPSSLNISSFTISSLEGGDLGNLEVDLLKGGSLSTMSSILNSNISIPYTDGNYVTSSEASFSTNLVSQGEFLRLDLKSIQNGQHRFFVNCYAEVS
jgi:hypothetical protein